MINRGDEAIFLRLMQSRGLDPFDGSNAELTLTDGDGLLRVMGLSGLDSREDAGEQDIDAGEAPMEAW